ncbi:MAG: hypothetical protein WC002_04185 [Candidatus Muiribacteriota bacterium]|jgi:hypothetical protein
MNFSYVKAYREADAIRALFLTVNEKGIPVDFRYTEKIKIEKIQKFMYGNMLDKYFKSDVLLEKYSKSIDFSVDFIFTVEEAFLESATFDDIVYMQETEDEPLEKAGSYIELSPEYYLVQHSFSGNPIKMKFKEKKVLDKFINVIGENSEIKFSHEFYIFEPFYRLDKLHEVL